MKSIKQILEELPEESRRQLLYGFEHEFAQFICLPEGKFIGVNVKGIKHLEITQEAGVWAIGNIKGEVRSCNI